jgi:hypothetical protein
MTLCHFEHMRSIVTVHNFVNFTIQQTTQLLTVHNFSQLFAAFYFSMLWVVVKL